ncbi:isochorismatase family protein [bacterium]|nr:isochorismatase family protein [bacterium]
MKKKYFTEENIAAESRQLLEELELKGLRRKWKGLSNTALVILDMQRYFLDKNSHAFIPAAPPVIKRIKYLAERFMKAGKPVFLTRHINTAEDAHMMREWWGELIVEENPLSELCSQLEGVGQVVRKTQYDAFYKSNLEEALREIGVKRIVIAGVMTHLCCESTARSAFVRGFEVLFPVDATATYNMDFHKATFLNLSHGVAIPVFVEDVVNVLEDGEE